MKNKQLQQLLEDLGLTENEAAVYLASLSLGPTTVLTIARTAQIRRTTVYSVIESLKKKGLIHLEPNGFKQLYVAEHPNKLETILENKKSMLGKLSPQFLALYNLKGKESTIKYYEGLGSIKTVYETVLEPMKPGDDYLVISDLQKFTDLDRPYFEKYIEKRSKKGISSRIISTESDQSQYMKKFSKNMNHELRVLSKERTLSVDIMITPYKVTFLNLEEPVSAVSIENQSIINAHKEMFEIMWASLPE